MRFTFSDRTQWNLLVYLYNIWPGRLTEKEFKKKFGSPSNKELLANIRQLIDDGFIECGAIEKREDREIASSFNLRLTPEGVKVMKESIDKS